MAPKQPQGPRADREEPRHVALVKAHVVGGDVPDPAASGSATEVATQGPLADEVLTPHRLSLKRLIELWEMSASLGPVIAAYVTNCDSFGHRFEPAINLDAPDVRDRIADALLAKRVVQEHGALPPPDARLVPTNGASQATEPTEADVEATLRHLKWVARLERVRLRAFFNHCCPKGGFTKLRKQLRLDLEITGNAFVEVVRAVPTPVDAGNTQATDAGDVQPALGLPRRLEHVQADTVRVLRLHAARVRVREWVQTSDLSWDAADKTVQFRRYVQVDHEGAVLAYFKEFGDPRVMSRKKGVFYASEEALKRVEGSDAAAATEILHLQVEHPSSAWGSPRWLGAGTYVATERELAEANLDFFRSNSVPPILLTVSGGALRRDSRETVQRFFEKGVRGRGSMHKAAILEAEPARSHSGNPVVPKIDVVPLRDSMQTDGMFMGWDDRCAERIRVAFGVPSLLVGRDRNLNRATAQAALKLAEDQVFASVRADFDAVINSTLLPALEIFFWKFCSNGPVTHDSAAVSQEVGLLVRAGAITANEARRILLTSGAYNLDLPPFAGEWANVPLPVLLANLGQQGLAAAMLAGIPTGDAAPGDAAPGDAEDVEPGTPSSTRVDGALRRRSRTHAQEPGS